MTKKGKITENINYKKETNYKKYKLQKGQITKRQCIGS
jgi:hypothetical protein